MVAQGNWCAVGSPWSGWLRTRLMQPKRNMCRLLKKFRVVLKLKSAMSRILWKKNIISNGLKLLQTARLTDNFSIPERHRKQHLMLKLIRSQHVNTAISMACGKDNIDVIRKNAKSS